MRKLSVMFTAVLAACGGSSPMSSGGGGNVPPGASVNLTEYRFSPETLRVVAGTVVQWSNGGTTAHTSTSDTPGQWNSNSLAPPGPPPMTCPYPPCDGPPGGTFEFKFSTAGTYPYHCAFHEALGMKGVVIVSP
jgi:plastocyanin